MEKLLLALVCSVCSVKLQSSYLTSGAALPPVSWLARVDPALESAGSMVVLMVTSKRAHWPRDTSQACYCHCFSPHREKLLTYTFPEDPPTLAGKSGSVSGGDIARFPWVLVH